MQDTIGTGTVIRDQGNVDADGLAFGMMD